MHFDTYFALLEKSKQRYLCAEVDYFEKERDELLFILGHTIIFMLSMEAISISHGENDRELTKKISEWLFRFRDELVAVKTSKDLQELKN